MVEDILDALFRQPPLIQLAVFVVNGLIDVAAGLALIRWFQKYPKPAEWTPVSTFQSSATVVFALFLAFHAASIWSNKTHAERTHIESGTAIKRLDDLPGPQQLNLAGIRVFAALKDLPPAVAGQLNALLNDAARARSERLWVGANHTEAVSWLAVMFLGLLAHLAVASVHIDKPRAGKLALGLFATATTMAFWSLGIVDDPFRFLQNLDPGTWLSS